MNQQTKKQNSKIKQQIMHQHCDNVLNSVISGLYLYAADSGGNKLRN